MNTQAIRKVIDEYYLAYSVKDEVKIVEVAGKMAAILGNIADIEERKQLEAQGSNN